MELELHLKETLRLGEGRMPKCQLIHVCLSYDLLFIKSSRFCGTSKELAHEFKLFNMSANSLVPLIETEVQSKVELGPFSLPK